MSWLKIILSYLFLHLSITSDVKIYWSDSNIKGQVCKVLYGSAVEFRCHNRTVDNLYEVSKDEYERCEPMDYQRSLLNCTRDVARGRGIYTTLIVQHDVPDPYFKDYIPGKDYYFISTASNRGTDKERLSNMAGGRCRYNDMRITLHVVTSLSESTQEETEASESDASQTRDPGGRDKEIAPDEVDRVPPDSTHDDQYRVKENDVPGSAFVEGLDQTDNGAQRPAHGVLTVSLLTLLWRLLS